jgi:hypothetical protein
MRAEWFMRWAMMLAGTGAALAPLAAGAQANMRREGALTLNQTSDDTKGFYAATIDPANGFAYFAAKYVYKVNLTTPLPTQVGAGVSFSNGHAFSGVMDSAAGCAYFAVGGSIYQILANGTSAPTAGLNMILPFGGSAFVTQLLIDTSDPSNHYLYAMTETGSASSTLYKLALNLYPSTSAILGSASTTAGQPALGYGVIDLTNRCAYYGTFIPGLQPPYVAKFALGPGSNAPANYGGVAVDTATNRSIGGIVLDIANGYGYCDSDGNDLLFGHGRVYKWALNGTNAPTLVSYVDMHTNEGYCHVALIKPDDGLLYFASDLSYPAYFYRFRLPPGTNAPVETGNLPLLGTTNTSVPAWGYNPTNSSNWGEVFARSLVYDPVRDFAYLGRDDADEQLQPYTDQIVKVALDRDEALIALTPDGANTNNAIPYAESFEAYANGFSLAGTNGWYAEDPLMGVVETNGYASTYTGAFPIAGPQQNVLQVDGAITNRFRAAALPTVWVDLIFQGKYWTDPIMATLSNTPFAFCVTTNGHLAVWNCTNPPAAGGGWTELLDTSIASNQLARVTVEADFQRDATGEFYYRAWVNGVASTNPKTWYAAADTNQNSFGDVVAQGRFALSDLVVTVPAPAIASLVRNADGSVKLQCQGMNGLSHRVWVATNLSAPSWQILSTNVAGASGGWQVTDTNAGSFPARFYRASLP